MCFLIFLHTKVSKSTINIRKHFETITQCCAPGDRLFNYSSAELTVDDHGSMWLSLLSVYSAGLNPSTGISDSAHGWKPAGLWFWSNLTVPGSVCIWINGDPAWLAQLEHNRICILIRNAIVPPSIVVLPFDSLIPSKKLRGTTVHKTGRWSECGLCQPDNPLVSSSAGLHCCAAWDGNLLAGWCDSIMLSLKEDA